MTLSLSAAGLTKVYDGRAVVDGVDFAFQRGKVHAVIGPNGSGKSTLLRLLSLLDPPTRGTVLFHDGEDLVEADTSVRRRMAFVFQRPSLFNTTVLGNVEAGLAIRGRSKRERTDIALAALRRVEMEKLAERNGRTLSGGESQRVALARALVTEPEVLFLDEPTANLDPHSVRIIGKAIEKLRDGGHTTILLVTHNMFLAQRLADRVVFLFDGRIVEEGEASDVIERPQDERTFRFLTGELRG